MGNIILIRSENIEKSQKIQISVCFIGRILAGWSCCKRCGSSNLETSPTSTSQEDVEKPDMEYPTESDEEKGKLGISNGGYQEW